jgi:branched-chain amino acid aminotransferase
MNHKIYQNGKEVSDRQAIALLRDEAAGVFETMRVYNGQVFLLEEHLQRLLESAKTVGYKPVPDLKGIRREISLAIAAFAKGDSPLINTSVRLTLLGGKMFVIAGTRATGEDLWEAGVALKTASFPRGKASAFPYQAKASSYQQAVLASTEPDPSGAFDWLFLDQGNYLTETRASNFFLVKYPLQVRDLEVSKSRTWKGVGVELLTPPEYLILNGVTRRFVIKCARETGLKVRETPLTRHEFFNADEAFLTNTSWGILPVRELDGRAIGTEVPAGGEDRPAQPWRPGPVTVKLFRFYQRRVQESCPSK